MRMLRFVESKVGAMHQPLVSSDLRRPVPVSEVVVVYVLWGTGILTYLHFALNIIRQMTKHLGIMCLSLPAEKKSQ